MVDFFQIRVVVASPWGDLKEGMSGQGEGVRRAERIGEEG
jgi:hypothetical protein